MHWDQLPVALGAIVASALRAASHQNRYRLRPVSQKLVEYVGDVLVVEGDRIVPQRSRRVGVAEAGLGFEDFALIYKPSRQPMA